MNERPAPESLASRVVAWFERIVMASLVVMMMVVVALSVVELGWIIAKDVASPPLFLLEVDELLEVFGFFLLVLIGVELLETIKAYMRENVVHVEIVIEVALIAIARKVIVLDVSDYPGTTLLAIAAILVALAAAYHIQRRARGSVPRAEPGGSRAPARE